MSRSTPDSSRPPAPDPSTSTPRRPGPGGARWSAVDLARALDQSHPPTAEQAAVIEAPLEPLLVVAGAGSGKTETMAARVVWLVANGFVRPDEVLGLTFTRKAAGELSERLTARLARLREAGLWTPEAEDGAAVLDDTPDVSTYHAYAGRIVREHGLRLGVEPESRLLTEAAAWQFAHDAVVAWDGPMDAVDKAESTVTTAVVDLAGEMAEHLVEPAEVAAHLAEVVATLEAVPPGEGTRKKKHPLREQVDVLRQRAAVVPVVEAYHRLKRSRDAMDFADQMAVAARLATTVPQVGAAERSRYKAVFLDEFQDTSEAQLRLLQALFVAPDAPAPVTAVGDPHQSIYGWRGASATTLDRFRTDFGHAGDADVLHLSTSWRNDRTVLDAANVLAAPLAATTPVEVRSLAARGDAGPGHVATARLETAQEEAEHLVGWLQARRARPGRSSAAVLCRKRSQFDPVVDALEAAGVAYEVVGLGGLLHTPEVADLVALLHVVADPGRGDRLMRLLTGPSCRLGAADLDGLGAWSRTLHDGTHRTRGADLDPEAGDRASIVEAMEDLPPTDWVGRDGERLSPPALTRLAGLAAAVRRLRSLSALGLTELVDEAELALGLDIEVLARPGYTPGAARAHLDAFADVAATFAASADRATLGGFLAWLEAAVDEERGLDLGWVEARPDAVQVMTVHAAKGLEWDVVAVPGLVEASFPAHSATQGKVVGDGWGHTDPSDKAWLTGLATLPYDLRGDRAGLPRLGWSDPHDWDSLQQAFERFTRAAADHGVVEERRLAYVAATRARHDLLLSAHVWGTATTPRVTSRFLDEVRGAGATLAPGPWVDMPPVADPKPQNPLTAQVLGTVWPTPDHLERRERLLGPAREVVDAAAAGPSQTSTGRGRWDEEVRLLLAERHERRSGRDVEVALPAHLSTSALVSLADDPDGFTASLRRPMPAPPALAARRGTAFHAWVEEHYARAAIVDVDALPGSADEDAGAEDLDRLRSAFLASEWAGRTPSEVETSVETVVDGIAVRGRVDAVFEDTDDQGELVWTVVDWKTGPPPTGRRAEIRALQLAAYRLAWARLRGVSEDRVRGAFFHAATGETVWPDLPDAQEISRALAAARPR